MKLLLGIALLALVSCGKDPEPTPGPGPAPLPVGDFKVTGMHIEVSGKMKAGSPVSVGEMKAAVSAAVKSLEN